MQNLLSLLPYLLCPAGMGLMMWFMMRDHKDNKGSSADTQGADTQLLEAKEVQPPGRIVTAPAEPSTVTSEAARAFRALSMCLNPRVIGVLALVGLGVWIVAPGLIGAALPLLLVAVCPLSMIVMMPGAHPGVERRQVSTSSAGGEEADRVA